MIPIYDRTRDPIQHVVYLVLENRSFDQILGAVPGVDGARPETTNLKEVRFNLDMKGNKHFQLALDHMQSTNDFPHSHDAQVTQMTRTKEDDEAKVPTDENPGFVRSLDIDDEIDKVPEQEHKKRTQEMMGFFPLGSLPVTHKLAQEFTVCDSWFSSFLGSTWPNRAYILAGTSQGHTGSPSSITDFYMPKQPTILDKLLEAKVTYGMFYHDFPTSLFMQSNWKPQHLTNYHKMKDFYEMAKAYDSEGFPSFSFIEPQYGYGMDPETKRVTEPSDQHAPHSVLTGDQLIGRIYSALRSNEKLWSRTLLVITYDEHGGYYDHRQPVPATIPDDAQGEEGIVFDQTGMRVPALLISPWLPSGIHVDSTIYDHTSLLKYLTEKWNLSQYGSLSRRVDDAKHFGHLFMNTTCRADALVLPPSTETETKTRESKSIEGENDFEAQVINMWMEQFGPDSEQALADCNNWMRFCEHVESRIQTSV